MTVVMAISLFATPAHFHLRTPRPFTTTCTMGVTYGCLTAALPAVTRRTARYCVHARLPRHTTCRLAPRTCHRLPATATTTAPRCAAALYHRRRHRYYRSRRTSFALPCHRTSACTTCHSAAHCVRRGHAHAPVCLSPRAETGNSRTTAHLAPYTAPPPAILLPAVPAGYLAPRSPPAASPATLPQRRLPHLSAARSTLPTSYAPWRPCCLPTATALRSPAMPPRIPARIYHLRTATACVPAARLPPPPAGTAMPLRV